ncbi:hypothetical protein EDEG_02016 [Edhazardia aedis USNM 41457]|uniref:Large ribosomal subunit protein uL10-like insertion domain-containing protein n=1 Tax=Edhazardia aedis (strain USNM 41457) TaxID=1003232 RepID=J9DQS1_EDHAE|nr:hypothetical protein EDEG_02016 [Edhazardia aedis USNM 41457]|eukprot:EJW03667.1 hypothetical protein EDEG_02016 [Edhazardia aedis USNM 41457]
MAVAQKKKRNTKEYENSKILNLTKEYKNLLLVEATDQRSSFLQKLRDLVRVDSKIIFGKRKMLIKSLEATKISKINKLTTKMAGSFFLLFTNRDAQEMVKFISEIEVKGFLRPNEICSEDIVLPSGIVKINDSDVPVDFEKVLRRFNVPVVIQQGKVICQEEYKICEKDRKIDVSQSKLLRMFGYELAVLKLKVLEVFLFNEE